MFVVTRLISGRRSAGGTKFFLLLRRLNFNESISNWFIKGIELIFEFIYIVKANPKTNDFLNVIKFDLVISWSLEIGFQFEGKDSKGLSYYLRNKILKAIWEFKFILSILARPG